MKTLGNIFLVLGTLLCLTILFIFWGMAFLVVGAILRIAAAQTKKTEG
jgi:hypothetical protein